MHTVESARKNWWNPNKACSSVNSVCQGPGPSSDNALWSRKMFQEGAPEHSLSYFCNFYEF